MQRIHFGLKSPRQITSKGYSSPDYNKPDVELVGEGVYSALMLDELLKQGVNVSCYTVKDLPRGTIVRRSEIDPSRFIRTFSTPRGLARVIGHAQYSVIFNLGLKVPESVIKLLGDDLWNIHPSKLPEYAGVADPVDKMVKEGRSYGHVTIHRVTRELDKGQILGHKGFRFKPNPRGKKYDPRLVSEIYRDSVIPASVELLKEVLEKESRIGSHAVSCCDVDDL
jgi:methionyl-tRNA formyltransferase